jgi:hypothetical protein
MPYDDEIVLPDNPPNYEGLPIIDQIRLLQEWAPLIAYGQRFLAAVDVYSRSIVVVEALAWLSRKTSVKFDDGLVRHADAILRTREGEDFVRWLVGAAEGKA